MEKGVFVPKSVVSIPEGSVEFIYTVPVVDPVEQVGPTFQCDCACPEVPEGGVLMAVGDLPVATIPVAQ